MSVPDKLTTIAENMQKVYEAGKVAGGGEDSFWDVFQQNGERTEYSHAFRTGWTEDIFKPKHTIKGKCYYAFAGSGVAYTSIDVDIIPTDIAYAFYTSQAIKTIRKLIVSKDLVYTLTFAYCGGLENITFEGEIGQDLDIHWSTKLTHDSLMSILNCLYDYSTESGSTHTLTIGAANLAKLTDAQKAIATEKGWTLA